MPRCRIYTAETQKYIVTAATPPRALVNFQHRAPFQPKDAIEEIHMSACDWKETGHKFFNKGNFRNALSAFTLALDLTNNSRSTSPDGTFSPKKNSQAAISISAELYWYRASTYERLGEYDKTVEDLSLCLELCSSPDFISFEIQESDVRKDFLRNLSLVASTSRDTLVARKSNVKKDEEHITAENDITGSSSEELSMLEMDTSMHYSGEAEVDPASGRQDDAFSESSSTSNQSRDEMLVENDSSNISIDDYSIDDDEVIPYSDEEDRRDETLLVRKNINEMDRLKGPHFYTEISDDDLDAASSPSLSLSECSNVDLPTPIRFEFENLSTCSPSTTKKNAIVAESDEHIDASSMEEETTSHTCSVRPTSSDEEELSSQTAISMETDTSTECVAAHIVRSDIWMEPITPRRGGGGGVVGDDCSAPSVVNSKMRERHKMHSCETDSSVVLSVDAGLASIDTELPPAFGYSSSAASSVTLSGTTPDDGAYDDVTVYSPPMKMLRDGGIPIRRCKSDDGLPSDVHDIVTEVVKDLKEQSRLKSANDVDVAEDSNLFVAMDADPEAICSLNVQDDGYKSISVQSSHASVYNTMSNAIKIRRLDEDSGNSSNCEDASRFTRHPITDLKVGDIYSADSSTEQDIVATLQLERDATKLKQRCIEIEIDDSSECSSTTIRGLSLLSEENYVIDVVGDCTKSLTDFELSTKSRRSQTTTETSSRHPCESNGNCVTNLSSASANISLFSTDQIYAHTDISAAKNGSINYHVPLMKHNDIRPLSRKASNSSNEICLEENDSVDDKQFNSCAEPRKQEHPQRIISSGSISSLSSCDVHQSNDSLSCLLELDHSNTIESRGLNIISETEVPLDTPQDQESCKEVRYPRKKSVRFSASHGAEPSIFDLLNPMNGADWVAIREHLKNHPWEAAHEGPYPLLIMLCDMGAPSDIVQLLIEAHPDAPKMRDRTGALALHYACYNGNPKNIITVLESFPEAAGVCVDSGLTLPMLLYLECSNRPRVSVIDAFLNAYPEGGARDSKPLEMAFGLWNNLNHSVVGHSNFKSHNSSCIPARDAFGRKVTMVDVEQGWRVVMALALHRINYVRIKNEGIVNCIKIQRDIPGRDYSLISLFRSSKQTRQTDSAFKKYRCDLITSHCFVNTSIAKTASNFDHEETSSLMHTALDNHLRWNEGIRIIWAANPNCVDVKDANTCLYPFMKAAVGDEADLTTIYSLAKRSTKLLSPQHSFENAQASSLEFYRLNWIGILSCAIATVFAILLLHFIGHIESI